MLDIITPLYAERDAACGVESDEATCDTDAPLISSALMLHARRLFLIRFAIGALENHGLTLPVQARYSNKLALLLGY
jgi:hypothetical protein